MLEGSGILERVLREPDNVDRWTALSRGVERKGIYNLTIPEHLRQSFREIWAARPDDRSFEELLPVVYVRPLVIDAFCRLSNSRLPISNEWLRAARADTRRRKPESLSGYNLSLFRADHFDFGNGPIPEPSWDIELSEVSETPSKFGVHSMIGWVWECVNQKGYAVDSVTHGERVLMGDSWREPYGNGSYDVCRHRNYAPNFAREGEDCARFRVVKDG
ncbi:MAG: SUMF1/EgtB/PvdO family nonheme iron enzyme [Candidatus Nanoarchaeia archaeon]